MSEQRMAEQLVTKSTADSYLVRSKDRMDWARIFIQGGERKPGENWGYISVVSSYGSFGHCFSHIGPRSIEHFLCGVGFDYLMGKFFGAEAQVFDTDKTLKWLRETIVRDRRDGDLDTEKARELWDAVQDADDNGYHSSEAFTQYLADQDSYFYNCFVDGDVRKSPNPQCVGFWEDIWPQFIEQLRAESTKAAA